ncbi:MAG: PfkB family carbohydrate kinase [Chloroflexi bacterium]|nr:PfkB family carbohydrate kinase [Chloroflexota bacterium]
MPDVVVVGAAARDLDPDERRGWRPGGGVSYGALLLARLGLAVGAVVGLDRVALDTGEPEALRAAGVEVVAVELGHGPVFDNRETASGRRQVCHEVSDPLPTAAVPAAWRQARAFLLVPVAGELGTAWAAVPGADAVVALGWQGLLRRLVPGEPPVRLPPSVHPIAARADVAALSREDLPPDSAGDRLEQLLARAGQSIAVTSGRSGGVYLCRTEAGGIGARRWRAVSARREVDPTGAGDVFLAALLAARLILGNDAARPGAALRFAAIAASLSVEDVGLAGVPDLAKIRLRLRETRAAD